MWARPQRMARLTDEAMAWLPSGRNIAGAGPVTPGIVAMAAVIALSLPMLAIRPASADMSSDPVIPDQPPLKNDQIIQLLDGKTYKFTDYDQSVTGTTHWDFKAHTVSGDYDFAGIKKGTYTAQWTVTGDKSCTTDHFQGTVCQTVYPYGTGFMEVNAKGKVHAVSIPQ